MGFGNVSQMYFGNRSTSEDIVSTSYESRSVVHSDRVKSCDLHWRHLVLLQYGIESKVRDIITYYARSHRNETPYNKIFKETHLLRNVREAYFEKDGWVQSNNLNIIYDPSKDPDTRLFKGLPDEDDEEETEEDSSSFKGAINAEPTMNDNVGVEILGRKSNNLFMNSMDYDMGAFYP